MSKAVDMVALQAAVVEGHRAIAKARAALEEIERLGGCVTLYGSPCVTHYTIQGSRDLALVVRVEL